VLLRPASTRRYMSRHVAVSRSPSQGLPPRTGDLRHKTIPPDTTATTLHTVRSVSEACLSRPSHDTNRCVCSLLTAQLASSREISDITYKAMKQNVRFVISFCFQRVSLVFRRSPVQISTGLPAILKYFVVFPSISKHIPGKYLKTGLDVSCQIFTCSPFMI
jgi:hypothetical protein